MPAEPHPLLALISDDDPLLRAQGLELLHAVPPPLRRAVFQLAVTTHRWTAALQILAPPHTPPPLLHLTLHAHRLLRLQDLRAALGAPLPSDLPLHLLALLAAPLPERPARWSHLCAALPPVPPPLDSRSEILSASLRARLPAEAVVARLRHHQQRWLDREAARHAFAAPPQPLPPPERMTHHLAEIRVHLLDIAAWTAAWEALLAAPSPAHLAAVEQAMQVAAAAGGARYARALTEEQEHLCSLLFTLGAGSDHLFGS